VDKDNTNTAEDVSSDMSFYVIMLAIIVAMAFYISYDMEKRYSASSQQAKKTVVLGPDLTPIVVTKSEPKKMVEAKPEVISVEKIKTVEIKPVADIPATESTPEAVIVEKTEQKTVVTTAVVAVPEKAEKVPAPVEKTSAPVTEVAPVVKVEVKPAEKAAVKEHAEPKVTPAAEKAEPVVATIEKPAAIQQVSTPKPEVQPMVTTMAESMKTMTAPVAKAVETVADKAKPVMPAQTQQAYQNSYQQAQQYANPYNYPPYGYDNQGYQNQGYQNQGYQNQGYEYQGYQNQPYYGNPYQQPARY